MKQIKKIGLWCVLLFACIQISGCGDSQTSWKSGDHEISSELTYEKSMDLDYATEFAVDYYENGFTLISISDGIKQISMLSFLCATISPISSAIWRISSLW